MEAAAGRKTLEAIILKLVGGSIKAVNSALKLDGGLQRDKVWRRLRKSLPELPTLSYLTVRYLRSDRQHRTG